MKKKTNFLLYQHIQFLCLKFKAIIHLYPLAIRKIDSNSENNSYMLRYFRFIKLFSLTILCMYVHVYLYIVYNARTFKIKIFSHKNFITFFFLDYISRFVPIHTIKQIHNAPLCMGPRKVKSSFLIQNMLLFVWYGKKIWNSNVLPAL